MYLEMDRLGCKHYIYNKKGGEIASFFVCKTFILLPKCFPKHPKLILLSLFLSFIGHFLIKYLDLLLKIDLVWENLRLKRIKPASSGLI